MNSSRLWFPLILSVLTNTVAVFSQTVPQIHFAVFQMTPDFKVKYCWEFSQPLHKVLTEDNYLPFGNAYFQYDEPTDFGHIYVKSNLTGQMIYHLKTCYDCGTSKKLVFPTSNEQVQNIQYGYENPEPVSVTCLTGTTTQSNAIWQSVQNTNVVNRVRSGEAYEVSLFPLGYNIYDNPLVYPTDWIVLVYSTPTPPVEIGFIGNAWPQKIMTQDVATTPFIYLHNFGGIPTDVDVNLTLSSLSTGTIYRSTVFSGLVLPDSTVKVSFDPLTVSQTGEYDVNFTLLQKDDQPWTDTFPEDNIWQEMVTTTTQPVFRHYLEDDPLGNIPPYSYLFDFDGDGDYDAFQYFHFDLWDKNMHYPRLFECRDGQYFDITNLIVGALPINVRYAYAADFNCNGLTDLLITNEHGPILFVGAGNGVFIEFTKESGLSGIDCGHCEVVDIEKDGDPDLVFGNGQLFENDGEGHFCEISAESNIPIPQSGRITCGDLNGDGYFDLVFSNRVFVNNGDGTFERSDISFPSEGMSVIFDFDGNGLNDIVFSMYGTNGISSLYKNLGNLRFGKVGINFPAAFNAVIADVNNDSYPDMLFDYSERCTYLYVNHGGTFTAPVEFYVDPRKKNVNSIIDPADGSIDPIPAQFLDLDHDGDLDLYSYRGTYENLGIRPVATMVETAPAAKPSSFTISNYPNPFNSATTIRFDMPAEGAAKLTIYSITGQKVRELVSGKMTAGAHSVIWDGYDEQGLAVSSGIYLVQLSTGDRRVNHMVTLMK